MTSHVNAEELWLSLPMVRRVRAAIAAHRFSFSTEDELQRGLAEALAGAAIPFEREVVLTKRDRIDFLLTDGTGIEVKIDGSISALTRQLHRYAEIERIASLVVVVGRMRLTNLPDTLNGKAVHRIPIVRAF